MAAPEDVARLAALARLSIPEEKLPALAAEFDSILSYIGQLDELSLARTGSPVVPATHNVFREDGQPDEPGTWTAAAVEQFPQKEGDALAVKQILSHD